MARFKPTKENLLKPRPCPLCGQMKSRKFLEKKRKEMGDAVRKSLAIAKANGEPVGRPKIVDYEQVKDLRELGLTYRDIANRLGCSVRTVNRAITGR